MSERASRREIKSRSVCADAQKRARMCVHLRARLRMKLNLHSLVAEVVNDDELRLLRCVVSKDLRWVVIEEVP